MRVLICGDREWTDAELIGMILDAMPKCNVIIEGEARGVDSLARVEARRRGIDVERYPADWDSFGRSAGPIRNREMLKAKPDWVIAFHDNLEASKGTKDMVTIARKAGLPTLVISHATKLPPLKKLVNWIKMKMLPVEKFI
jgi:hypothetical protein